MSDATITTQDGTEFACASGDTILRAALRAGLGMPYSCNTGSCGNCRFDLIEGSVKHARSDAPAWGERDLKRNRWLGCQALPQSDCTIKFRADLNAISHNRPAIRTGELVSATRITRDISDFAFRIEGPDAFRPGQYALISAPGVDGPRAYSMSNLPGQNIWRFMVKQVPGGAATNWLFSAKPGDSVTVDGPYGTAWLREESLRNIVLMAGGSGLSPMISIARGALAAGLLETRKLHLFYGCRDREDLFEPAILGQTLGDRIALIEGLSDPAAPGAWDGATGFLHDVVQGEMGDTLKDHEIYFAGPAVMSAAVQKMAYDAGVPQTQLHFDEFF